MAYKHDLLNSWLVVFSPTVQGCLKNDYTEFDYDKWEIWCQKSANSGANGIRILPYAPWSQEGGAVPINKLWSPNILENGKWNLDKWNETYFQTLVKMIEIASNYKLKIWFSLFDNCQWHHQAGGVTPWGNNTQRINGYYGSLPYALKWVDKVFSYIGTKVNYEIINEGEERQLSLKSAAEWIIAVFDHLIEKGVLPENVCWGPLPSSIYEDGVWEQDREHDLAQHILSITERRDREQSNKVYRAMHGVGVADEVVKGETFPASYCGEWGLQWWGRNHSGKGFLSDDGVRNGANTQDREPNGIYTRPSGEQWYKVLMKVYDQDGNKAKKWVIERLPSNMNPDVWVPTLESLSKAYKDSYGTYPDNYGKFPYVAECQIGDVKKATCPNGEIITTHICVENKWQPTGNSCPEEPTDCKCIYYLNIRDFLFGIPNFIKCLFGKISPYCKK